MDSLEWTRNKRVKFSSGQFGYYSKKQKGVLVMELYTVSEVSSLLKINKNLVYELIKHQKIKAMKLGSLKVSSFELADFIKRSEGLDYSDLKNPTELKTL